MITMQNGTPDNLLALSVAGTVVAGDVDRIFEAWLNGRETKAGRDRLVLEVDRDFDGYDAEIVHAVSHFNAARRRFERIAVIADANFSDFAREELARVYCGALRFFPVSDAGAGFAWASA